MRSSLPGELVAFLDSAGGDGLAAGLRVLRDQSAELGWAAAVEGMPGSIDATGGLDEASVALSAARAAAGDEAVTYVCTVKGQSTISASDFRQIPHEQWDPSPLFCLAEHQRRVHAVTGAVVLYESAVMHDSIDKGSGELVIAEHRSPTAGLDVGRGHQTPPLVAARHRLEEQPRPPPRRGARSRARPLSASPPWTSR